MTPYDIANSDAIKTQFLETGRMQVWMFDGKHVDHYVDAIRTAVSTLGWEPDDLEMNLIDHTIHVEIAHRKERAERRGQAMANWGGW